MTPIDLAIQTVENPLASEDAKELARSIIKAIAEQPEPQVWQVPVYMPSSPMMPSNPAPSNPWFNPLYTPNTSPWGLSHAEGTHWDEATATAYAPREIPSTS